MEGKKKFEKPELQVVELKQAVLAPASSCPSDGCGCNLCPTDYSS